MENFTPESLKKFISQREIEQKKSGSKEAYTARGQRVSEVLRQRGGQEGQTEAKGNLDALIRQNMGELVRKYVQAGKFQDLKTIMEEHKNFINEILNLVENSMNKKG